MKALGWELFGPFVDAPGNLLKISRIYRDARMHHPVPYKESLWLCIRQDVQWWAENPCLFLEVNPEGIDYGFFIWQPRVATMDQFRRHIAAQPDAFLELIRQAEEKTGMAITAECYKRPKPCEDPRLEPYFAWKKQIGCIRHEDFGPESLDRSLVERVADFFTALTPVYEYFNQSKV